MTDYNNDSRASVPEWQREKSDPLSDANIEAEIDKLDAPGLDKLVRLAARKLAGEGVSVQPGDDSWIGACYDIMRNLIENDVSLDEIEEQVN
jgi:hypothetical protein